MNAMVSVVYNHLRTTGNDCEHFSNECAFGEHYSRQSGEGNE